jgi:ribosomal-protein-alanine N-acetyltransferase
MYTLRYMTPDDIPQVLEIDKLSFASPWPERSYTFEINDNKNAHMIALVGLPDSVSSNGQKAEPIIIGYGGMWLIDGEAHISTIAVHPDYRGRGLGEVLLTGMLARAMSLDSQYSILEVRVSNQAAINLYKKYEYVIVGRRKRYYRDNNEDAFLMHLAPLNRSYQARFQEHVYRLKMRVTYVNQLAPTGESPASQVPRS